MSNSGPDQRGFAPIVLIASLIGVLIVGRVIGSVYYTGAKSGNSPLRNFKLKNLLSQSVTSESSASGKEASPQPQSSASSKSAYEILKSRTASGFSSSNIAPTSTTKAGAAVVNVTPAANYGFTETLEMPVIGVRGIFPEGTSLSLNGTSYMANIGEDRVHIGTEDYDGGGRRAWFQKQHTDFDFTFEPFSGKNNSGYITYMTKPVAKDIPRDFYYFTAIGSDKMLVVMGNNNGSNFFGNDLSKFKSFVSTIQLIGVSDAAPDGVKTSDMYNWSDQRKTLWEDQTLGLKITAPEWMEFRSTAGRNIDGTYKFTDWSRTTFDITSYPSNYYINNYPTTHINIPVAFGTNSVTIFSSEFKNQNFNDVVSTLLFPAGFCSTEWKQSKSSCDDPNSDYCYTKDEVIKNLKIIESAKVGQLDAQLRGLDPDFSYKNDCRAEDTWVIKARDGSFVLSDFGPDQEEIVRMESNF